MNHLAATPSRKEIFFPTFPSQPNSRSLHVSQLISSSFQRSQFTLLQQSAGTTYHSVCSHKSPRLLQFWSRRSRNERVNENALHLLHNCVLGTSHIRYDTIRIRVTCYVFRVTKTSSHTSLESRSISNLSRPPPGATMVSTFPVTPAAR